MNRKKLEKLSEVFLTQFFSMVIDHIGIDVSGLAIDHICWRCESQDEYESMESNLLSMGTLFHKSIHNGRSISLIELSKPILFREQQISMIELPAPKEGKSYPSGFEHAEFVIPGDLGKFKNQYPNLPWNDNNVKKAINPDIKLTLQGITVKFHPYTLAHVVKNLEQG